MRTSTSWTLIATVASLAVSCGPYTEIRPTRIDNAREDDHWLEGERCPTDPANMPDAAIRVEVIAPGTGEIAARGMTVRVHYVVKAAKSEAILHDTRKEGPANQIIIGSTHTICGFEKALIGMRAGEERRVYVPWQLAFGEAGRPPEVQPRTDLVFVIDLYLPSDYVPLGVSKGGARPPTGAGMGGGGRR